MKRQKLSWYPCTSLLDGVYSKIISCRFPGKTNPDVMAQENAGRERRKGGKEEGGKEEEKREKRKEGGVKKGVKKG